MSAEPRAWIGRYLFAPRLWVVPTPARARWRLNGGLLLRPAEPDVAARVVNKPVKLDRILESIGAEKKAPPAEVAAPKKRKRRSRKKASDGTVSTSSD